MLRSNFDTICDYSTEQSKHEDIITFIRKHIHDLDVHLNKSIRPDLYVFGLVSFLCGALFSIIINDKFKYRTRVMNLTLLYLLVDNVLDSNDPIDVKSFIAMIKYVINDDIKNVKNNLPLNPNHLLLHPSVAFYRQIVRYNLRSMIATLRLLESEIKSVIVQSDPNRTYDEYLDICREKGGRSGALLYHIITDDPNDEDLEQFFHICFCCQLVDDIMDYQEDKSNNIHTIATHEFNKNGHLDDLFTFTLHELEKIDHKYNLFRYALMILLLYESSKNRIITSKLRRNIDKYIILHNGLGEDVYNILIESVQS